MPHTASRIPMIHAVIAAAGNSSRFGTNKLFVPLAGRPMLCTTLESVCRAPVHKLAVVCRRQDEQKVWACLTASRLQSRVHPLVGAGGATRAESVGNGLKLLIANGAVDSDWVLVHDAARPLIDLSVMRRLLLSREAGDIVVPAVAVVDSLRRETGVTSVSMNREGIMTVQTPQLVRIETLRRALEQVKEAASYTDESALIQANGGSVALVDGDPLNLKITAPRDAQIANALLQGLSPVVVGFGYDVHRFAEGRPLVLGGVRIPSDVGLEGTSDADAVLHSIMDAILGCEGQGDIGRMFPSSDSQYEGIASSALLAHVLSTSGARALTFQSVDITIVAERPRLFSYQQMIARNIASLLDISAQRVNVKVTGNDAIGWIGKGEGIAALCVVTALKTK